MGLGEWVSEFFGNLVVPGQDSISSRYRSITGRLNTDFWTTDSDTSHSLYVGSYGRNTAIKGFSDLDMLFQLPYSLYEQYSKHLGNGQSALLQAVRASISQTYSNTNVSRRRPGNPGSVHRQHYV
jgi:tRNA nucleotidyltransferase (CCA-adding enzyme)